MNSQNIGSLTGLRGIAAWVVVVYHFRDVFLSDFPKFESLLANGYYAVDLFFVLSGFVIYLSAQKYFTRLPWKISVRKFYIDRLARIYPLHIFILLLFVLNPLALLYFSTGGLVSERYSIGYFLASIFLVQNWGLFDELRWNIPAWSISAEAAAYLVFPIGYLVVSRINTAFSAAIWLVFGLVAFAILCVVLGIESLGADISRFGTVRCLFEFTMGTLIARIYVLNVARLSNSSSTLAITFLLFLCWILDRLGVYNFLFIPAIICAIVLVLVKSDGFFSRVLEFQIFMHFGAISYSLYLVHYLIKDWVKYLSQDIGYQQFFIYMTLTYIAALALYRFIEVPSKKLVRNALEVRSND